MTMRITVKNEDAQRTARVTPHVAGQVETQMIQDVPPGVSRDFYIHNGKTLTIEEVQS